MAWNHHPTAENFKGLLIVIIYIPPQDGVNPHQFASETNVVAYFIHSVREFVSIPSPSGYKFFWLPALARWRGFWAARSGIMIPRIPFEEFSPLGRCATTYLDRFITKLGNIPPLSNELTKTFSIFFLLLRGGWREKAFMLLLQVWHALEFTRRVMGNKWYNFRQTFPMILPHIVTSFRLWVKMLAECVSRK